MKLHVVIYSEVLLYSGGRETWLGYFLPLLAARERFEEIHVFHMRPSDPARALPAHMPPAEGTPIRFHAAPVVIHGGGGPLRRFGSFARTVLSGLHRHAGRGDLLLAVGVQGEAPPALLGWLVSVLRGRRLRLVVWFREANLLLVKKRRGRAVHAALRLLQHGVVAASTSVVTNGEHTLEIYQAAYPRKRGRMRLVPNAVELERFAGLPLPDPNDRPIRIAFVGRFMPEKGFLDFLEAAGRVADQPGVTFAAWGNTADGGADARPPENVTLHPPVPHTEIPTLLASQHAVVFLNRTPWSSGLSHALLEALAAGRLVIAWDIPCHRQVVNHENGILLPEGDVAGLAAVFRELASGSSVDLAAKGAAARATAARYSCAVHVDRFLAEVVDAEPSR